MIHIPASSPYTFQLLFENLNFSRRIGKYEKEAQNLAESSLQSDYVSDFDDGSDSDDDSELDLTLESNVSS